MARFSPQPKARGQFSPLRCRSSLADARYASLLSLRTAKIGSCRHRTGSVNRPYLRAAGSILGSMRMSTMSMRTERTASPRGSIRAAAGDLPKKKPDLKKVLPEVWKLVRPRRWLLLFGLLLMAINRVAGLVLPASTKYLIDTVMRQHHADKLLPLVGVVFAATAIQAVTSFSLTQLLSKAAQRMIAELRKQVQQHIGLLPVSFYDANRTGTLVSRIMSDVEGVRNLIGTGLVECLGGIMTAILAFAVLLHTSRKITLIVFAVIAVFVILLQRAFKT